MRETSSPICMPRIEALLLAAVLTCNAASARELRVCADPNNLPFSNEQREGFENKVAELIAQDLGAELRYAWIAQRRGFIRNGLQTGECDLVTAVAAGMEMLATTQPYYRSSYVFVTREDRQLDIHSFDDSRLHTLTVGVQLIGDDFANTPPAHALTRRGIVDNVRGYPVYGDYSEPNPPRAIVDAVARGDIDVAIAWGPMAGYFSRQSGTPLRVTPVEPKQDAAFPMTFAIAMGVRRGEVAFKEEIQQALARHRADINRLLSSYGVPVVALEPDIAADADRDGVR